MTSAKEGTKCFRISVGTLEKAIFELSLRDGQDLTMPKCLWNNPIQRNGGKKSWDMGEHCACVRTTKKTNWIRIKGYVRVGCGMPLE